MVVHPAVEEGRCADKLRIAVPTIREGAGRSPGASQKHGMARNTGVPGETAIVEDKAVVLLNRRAWSDDIAFDRIGGTPLVVADGVYVKLECANPGGSEFFYNASKKRWEVELDPRDANGARWPS